MYMKRHALLRDGAIYESHGSAGRRRQSLITPATAAAASATRRRADADQRPAKTPQCTPSYRQRAAFEQRRAAAYL